MQLEIFGIRHHGPGSARSMLLALDRFAPDVVLIEGPPDAEALIPWVADASMQTPVAMLVYNPKNLSQASFLPFATFSPEWQAMRYGLECGVPIRFMDLPMGISFALKEESTVELFADETQRSQQVQNDPFRRMAALAGYSDPERWWDALVERQAPTDHTDTEDFIFPLLVDLMRALREDKNQNESPETLLREAHMRQTIRQAQKDGFQRIAVVCGAWHGPALADVAQIKASADAALLKGLKKVKTESTWIPWSYDRLATQSGYSAGIVAPGWYDILWENSAAPAAVWLTKAAQLLRTHDLPVSSAHVMEAARLANTLATLRQTALPGLEELREAAVTVLCEGSEKMLELIDRQLVIGDRLGAIPDAMIATPLKADFEQQVRSCRLEKSTQEKTLELDLREAAHLRKSQFLHRLSLLDLPWGKTAPVGSGKQGRFHENWQMKWLPDYEIRLIEAGVWGSTIAEAANKRARRKVQESEQLSELVRLLDIALKADLPAIVPDLLLKLRNLSALAQDVLLLADAILPLAEVLRYGNARQTNPGAIEALLDQMAPRVCIQLPAACIGINEDVAVDILKKIMAVNRAFGILQVPDYESLWAQTLLDIHHSEHSAALLSGACCRLSFDKKLLPADQSGDAMRYQLSKAQAPGIAAQWLDGFLHGSGLLLLHYPELWHILNEWVRTLPDDFFREILPVLRRTFSRFTPPERSKMLDLSKNEHPESSKKVVSEEDWNTERTEGIRAILNVILQ
ncbi:MAG: hypothetical protein IT262_07485 [Saprospiraceae bacterium]|nr:hypothetical protein [Saprospiraceae bacterium]